MSSYLKNQDTLNLWQDHFHLAMMGWVCAFLKERFKTRRLSNSLYIPLVNEKIAGVIKLLHRLGFSYKKPKLIPGENYTRGRIQVAI
ncbi:MAG: winged helix-turn-helix domain-containing protein [Candidatus Midichloria sp.]|nr:winged helix-turn-helix domain-containing protein [Candidatus Midichloria sp.]